MRENCRNFYPLLSFNFPFPLRGTNFISTFAILRKGDEEFASPFNFVVRYEGGEHLSIKSRADEGTVFLPLVKNCFRNAKVKEIGTVELSLHEFVTDNSKCKTRMSEKNAHTSCLCG